MVQIIDAYGQKQQAMAQALQILQQRQAMNEQRRQWEEQQRILQQNAAIAEEQRLRGNSWEDEIRDFARRQMAGADPAMASIAGMTIYTDKVPNAETTQRRYQQQTMTPEELRNADLYATNNAVSPVKQAELGNAQTVAEINQRPNWARVPAQNAADYGRANSSNASAKLFTVRAENPQAAQKPVQTRLDPQTEAKANRLVADIDNLQKKIAQNEQIRDKSALPTMRRRAQATIDKDAQELAKKQADYNALVKTFPSEAYTTPSGTSDMDAAILAEIAKAFSSGNE